jgi:drug/metabolite transporter (DMT)-like permease
VPYARVFILTLLALTAFAGNSLFCRAALASTHIDAASFTTVRLLSGAVVLRLVVLIHRGAKAGGGNWLSALVLFAYAAGFSFSYVHLTAAAGALLLFGAVQTTMIGCGLWRGERLRELQMVGLILAIGGLVGLLLPGLSAPPLMGALLMLGAGVAWGVYSLRGKVSGNPLQVTAGNFARAAAMSSALSALLSRNVSLDPEGIWYAVLSGALASGVGYVIWYMALPLLRATTAATVQLSVPVIAAMGGVFFLEEPLTLRLIVAAVAIIGGIGLVVLTGGRSETPAPPAPPWPRIRPLRQAGSRGTSGSGFRRSGTPRDSRHGGPRCTSGRGFSSVRTAGEIQRAVSRARRSGPLPAKKPWRCSLIRAQNLAPSRS